MSLRITLKPGEKLLIGRLEIVNGPLPADFRLQGERVPVLRGSEILLESEIKSPCTKLYFDIQNVYLDQNNDIASQNLILKRSSEIVEAAASLKIFVADVMSLFLLGDYYKALQSCRRLISEERFIFEAADLCAERTPKRHLN